MDLEKAYDRVDWLALWDILKIYGVGGKLLSAVNPQLSRCTVSDLAHIRVSVTRLITHSQCDFLAYNVVFQLVIRFQPSTSYKFSKLMG